MVSVRAYKDSDKERVQNICLANADCADATEDTKKYILLMYCNYYIEKEPENCFVVADAEDNAVGYILCAEDYDTYERVFKEKYLPRVKKLGISYTAIVWAEFFVHKIFKKQYPSHLHIDILPICQGKGAGSQLVEALCAHLKEKNSCGLMLSCGSGNKGALRFYSRNGFIKKANIFGNCLMCRNLK